MFTTLKSSQVSSPLVSVVITTKNEEKNIRTCLQSIQLQTWPNIETIVVDNNSWDKTKIIAQEYTSKVYDKGPERSAQRNYGIIEKSVGKYAIYLDADMILSPITIEACVSYIRSSNAIALYIPEIVLGKTYLSCIRRFERSFYDGTPIDGARFFERSSFIRIGGFDENLFIKGSGEDWDIDKMLKQHGNIDLLPRYIDSSSNKLWKIREFIEANGVCYNHKYTGLYHNEAQISINNYLKKKSYYTLGFDGYINKWGKDDPDIKRQFGLVYRFWTVFTENGKWRKLLNRIDLVLGMYFLRFCVGLVFISKNILHRNRHITQDEYSRKH